jgi:hypothetical protein
LVHQCRPDRSIFVPLVHLLSDHLVTIHRMFGKSLYVDSSILTFPHFKSSCWSLIVIRDKQVLDFFIIDFEHRELDLVFAICISGGIDFFEDLVTSNRDYSNILSVPHHGITLTRSCLSVSKQTTVVT